MGTTFQKRQKEMKRLDKQQMKAARRAQRKLMKEGKSLNTNDPTPDAAASPLDQRSSVPKTGGIS